MPDTLSSAMTLRDAGWSVIPLRWRDKRPDGQALKWVDSLDDEGWPTWNTYKSRTATDAELRTWFTLGGRHNLGVVTGFNGLTVLDFDTMDAYDAWLQLAGDLGPAAKMCAESTYRVRTARGMHVYIRTEAPVTSFSVGKIDVKAMWGYVLTEPSVHPCGHVYQGDGQQIVSVGALSEVFPLEPTSTASSEVSPTRVMWDDPWDSAEHATGPIGASAIEAIKLRFTPADILGLGTARGRVERIKCPLHNGTNPSEFTIYADGHWKCWSCGRYGDALDLYAALHNVPLADAVAALEGQL